MGGKGYISEPWVNPSQKDKLPRINKPHDSITSAWEYTMGLYTPMKKISLKLLLVTVIQ